MSRLARPSRNAAPVVVAVAILGIWWLVAHNGGSGWVQALGDVVFGTLFIGIFGPAVVLTLRQGPRRQRPVDGIAGHAGRLPPRGLDPAAGLWAAPPSRVRPSSGR